MKENNLLQLFQTQIQKRDIYINELKKTNKIYKYIIIILGIMLTLSIMVNILF